MTSERASLRLRLLAIVVAAAMVPIAPLTIVLLLQIRDALYARGIADARARLADVVQRCSGGTCPDAAGVRKIDRPCTARSERVGELLVLCEDVPAGAVQLRQDLRPIREQLAALDRRILAVLVLFVGLLVTIAVWLLERGVGRRLERIDAALEAVGAEQQGPNLLPEGGDSVGRVGAAVNRLAQRLRDERGRTRSQIEALETANQKLREAREDLARSERLASVGRLAAGVAHEVGNPVSALIGYAALMRERIAQGKDVAGYTERIEREASRIDRIVRDLLELARPPAALQAVDLGRAVEVARGAVAPQHAKVAFETTLPPELPPVRGDEHLGGGGGRREGHSGGSASAAVRTVLHHRRAGGGQRARPCALSRDDGAVRREHRGAEPGRRPRRRRRAAVRQRIFSARSVIGSSTNAGRSGKCGSSSALRAPLSIARTRSAFSKSGSL